jgi:alkylation response protein AidB-like acyl-CoA dehydrogenase
MFERSTHREELLAAADRLAGQVTGDAAEAEREGKLTAAVDAGLRDARLYDAFLPKELGGLGVDPLTLIEIAERVAASDGSAGWCLGTSGMISGFAATRLPEAGAREIFTAGQSIVLAGGYVPRCRVAVVAGGYRVSGRMPFASGCRNADALVVTGLVDGVEGPDAMRSCVVAPSEVTILDNWQVAGLEGTSSNDLELDDVFVPQSRSFAPFVDAPLRGAAEWRAPLLAFAAVPHLGFALGVARHALEEIAAHAGRQRIGSAAAIAERPVFQRDYGRARVRLRAARLAAFAAFEDVMSARGEASLEERAELAAAIAHSYATATETSEFAFRAGGATSLYRTSALQRCFRDAQAGAQHIVASEEAFERAGRVFLGGGDPGFI